MTYRIIIEPTAEREIRSTVRWKTENASPTAAARWYNGLIQKIETLRRHPTRCPLAAENDKFDEEIRELGGVRKQLERFNSLVIWCNSTPRGIDPSSVAPPPAPHPSP
jgi:plasmid stabilization system protein ParE